MTSSDLHAARVAVSEQSPETQTVHILDSTLTLQAPLSLHRDKQLGLCFLRHCTSTVAASSKSRARPRDCTSGRVSERKRRLKKKESQNECISLALVCPMLFEPFESAKRRLAALPVIRMGCVSSQYPNSLPRGQFGCACKSQTLALL